MRSEFVTLDAVLQSVRYLAESKGCGITVDNRGEPSGWVGAPGLIPIAICIHVLILCRDYVWWTGINLFEQVVLRNEKQLRPPLLSAMQAFVEKHGAMSTAQRCSLFTINNALYSGCTGLCPEAALAYYSVNGFHDWLPDILLRLVQPWTVDDLPDVMIGLIGIVAHNNHGFLESLKASLLGKTPSNSPKEQVWKKRFTVSTAVEIFRKLTFRGKHSWLLGLIGKGTVEILKPFLETGIEPSVLKYGDHALLRLAVVVGSHEKTRLLLMASNQEGSPLSMLFRVSHLLENNVRYQQLLDLLIANTSQRDVPRIESLEGDPLLELFTGPWKSKKYPRAHLVKVLLTRGNFHLQRLLGEMHQEPSGNTTTFLQSYTFKSIVMEDAGSLNLFLQYGAKAHMQIGHLFDRSVAPKFQWWEDFGSHCFDLYWSKLQFSPYTWLELSLFVGSISCARILIQHGADVTKVNGSGRSAIHIAKSNMLALHPRNFSDEGRLPIGHEQKLVSQFAPWMKTLVTIEEDREALAVVKQAFELQYPTSGKFENYEDPVDEFKAMADKSAFQRLQSWVDSIISMLQDSPTEITDLLYRHGLISGMVRRQLHDLWCSTFADLLLMRFLYVVSYALLFFFSLQELAVGNAPFVRPSRTALFMTTASILALTWIASRLSSN